MHLAVALLPEIPQPLVVHLLVLGRGNEARGGFRLIDGPIAMDLGAARLRLRPRAQRFRGALGVVEATAVAPYGVGIARSQQLGVQHGGAIVRLLWMAAHPLAPFRIWAMWMNLSGTPMRSAQWSASLLTVDGGAQQAHHVVVVCRRRPAAPGDPVEQVGVGAVE